MKGLIYKDILCLKKNLKMFVIVAFMIFSISLMYVLSSKYGNVASWLDNQDFGEDTMSKALLLSMTDLTLLIIINIPMAFAGNLIDCFKEDKKAGFHNILFAMPISKNQIVVSRYASLFLYLMIGFVSGGASAIAISIASDTYTFPEMLGTVFSFAGINIAYMSIVIPLLYYFGSNRSEIICVIPIVIALIAISAILVNKFKGISDEAFDAEFLKSIDSFIDSITTKGIFVFLGGIGCLLCSYFLSVKAFMRKGDVRS